MSEEYLEQVIKNTGMTYTATAQHELQAVLLQINQNKQTKTLSPLFPPTHRMGKYLCQCTENQTEEVITKKLLDQSPNLVHHKPAQELMPAQHKV